MKNRFPFLFLSLLVIGLFSTQQSSAQHIAKYAGDFISVGTGPRAMGMGGAFVAIAEGSIASYWNPAGLARLDYPEIHLMYAERFAGIVKYNYAIFAMPFREDAGIAIGLMRMGVDDIPYTELIDNTYQLADTLIVDGQPMLNTPQKVRSVNDVEYVGYFSYAKKWGNNRWLGGNVKVIRKGIGDNSAWGIGFDLGLLLPVYKNLRFGATVQDITTTLITWDTGNKELISPNVRWGFTYPFHIYAFDILPAFSIDTRFEGIKFASQQYIGDISFDSHFGAEIAYKDAVFLRTGSDIGKFTAGAGIQLPRLRFDAAFLSHETLGNTYRVSLTLSLEEEKFRRKEKPPE